ncbi:hypothetical protein [Marinisporobacter balticus]|uniref:Uncharacterized protein n=1 Tax=Marinisporobacter balticus TaxID=2018667 RepID=A0A4R2KX36_9FIRM|nr:hypothetical protein [Marinisporobacter balticus]TCO79131.1 hypothetical protein EV214_103183 [Marinisporobacter balticus]
MNVEQIKIQAERNNEGMAIKNQYVIGSINECIQSVLPNQYESACKRAKITIAAKKDTIIDLPIDLVKVKKMKRANSKYGNFEVFDNQIEFENDGIFDINYLRKPKEITTMTETPEINSAFHYAIALFVAAREKNRLFGSEDVESQRLMSEFLNEAQNANVSVLSQNGTRRIVAMPYWG